MQYNGLKSDFNSLSKFVFIYETRIKRMNREDEFIKFSSNAFYLFKHKLRINIKYATMSEIKNIPQKTKQTLFFTKKRNLIIDFCRHLRNSFSHGLLKKENNNMIISDVYRKNYTSKGFLEYEATMDFVIEIIKDFENVKY